MNPATRDSSATLAESSALPPVLPAGLDVALAQDAAHRLSPWWQTIPLPPIALTAVLLAYTWIPPVRDNPRLVATFYAIAGALFTWELALWLMARRSGQLFRIEYFPVKSHYVQACVQFSIMLYWGWYWRNVYAELPLILSQVVYFYALDALLSWSRGRTWRLGYGPLPVVISTNLLLWFKHDWYYLQFLMLTTGALAKQFITWEREGKRTHIFNPSAFGQFLFAIGLIATGTTKDFTWGPEIARFFEVPHMLIVIFLGGLVVQYLFHVTLMTLAATVTLIALNLVYTEITGVYVFVNISIAAPIFLGLHLLVTDPATSPRTNAGRVLFGVLYGLGYAILFRVLDVYGVPLFWDKLLPVPILNLCVPLIDRWVRSGWVNRLNGAWERWPSGRMNLVHMGCWAMVFIAIEATGFVEAPHPGDSIPFWKQAVADGKPYAGPSLVMAAGAQAEGRGDGAAYNELGLICMEGSIVNKNNAGAAHYFSTACALNDENGCVNVAIQFLFLRERRSDDDAALALDKLEHDCATTGNTRSCYLLGFAYEFGRGRPIDKEQALRLYERAGLSNLYAVKGLARIALSGVEPPYDARPLVRPLGWSCENGDAESCWYLAYMYHHGVAFRFNAEKAIAMLQRACELGSEQACEALRQPELPSYSNPRMLVPGWSTAYSLDTPGSGTVDPAISGATQEP